MSVHRLMLAGVLLLPSLAAQDFKISAPIWVGADDQPDQLPVIRELTAIPLPPGQAPVVEPGYIKFRLTVMPDGKISVGEITTSLPWLPSGYRVPTQNSIPAKRQGKPVASEVALFMIYNSAAAAEKIPDAMPRLLAVQSPVLPDMPPLKEKPKESDMRVRVRLEIDARGVVTKAEPLPGKPEAYQAAAAQAVKNWKFAPARVGGKAVAAPLEVSVVFDRPRGIGQIDGITPPKELVVPNGRRQIDRRLQGMRGEVEVAYTVTTEGRITDAYIVRASHPLLEEWALDSIRNRRFIPAQKDGHPVAYETSMKLALTSEGDRADGFKIVPPKSFPPNLPEQMQFDRAPLLEYLALPVYPREDLGAKRGGKVLMAYVVNPEGKVTEISVLPGAPSPSLAAAAVAALEQYRFTPPGRKGQPCYALLRIELEFVPDGRSGHAPVTDATRRILQDLEKFPGKFVEAAVLDEPLHRRPGLYPQSERYKGETLVEFVLDQDGIPRLPQAVSASDPALGYAAVQAVSQWRYSRPRLAGKNIEVRVRVPVVFK